MPFLLEPSVHPSGMGLKQAIELLDSNGATSRLLPSISQAIEPPITATLNALDSRFSGIQPHKQYGFAVVAATIIVP